MNLPSYPGSLGKVGLIPTKTPPLTTQSKSRSGISFCRAAVHVWYIRVCEKFLLGWVDAMNQSITMHWKTLVFHLVSIAAGVCWVPWMVLTHLKTQIKCINSESKILSSLDGPFLHG